MNKIKFSEDYDKLPIVWDGTQALLIAVYPCKIDDIKKGCPAFIEYDTKIRGKDKHYPLNFDDGLILVFIHQNTGLPFTTIRRNYKEKFEYYNNSVGDMFVMAYSPKEDKPYMPKKCPICKRNHLIIN